MHIMHIYTHTTETSKYSKLPNGHCLERQSHSPMSVEKSVPFALVVTYIHNAKKKKKRYF